MKNIETPAEKKEKIEETPQMLMDTSPPVTIKVNGHYYTVSKSMLPVLEKDKVKFTVLTPKEIKDANLRL
jgi:hypothetical protein